MIRFIDLRHHEGDLGGPRFAFFDTVTDTFMPFAGEQVFDTLADFREAAANSPNLDRCIRLCPDWTRTVPPNGCPVCNSLNCPPWAWATVECVQQLQPQQGHGCDR